MEEHLLRVADFLRGTPFVNLSLAPVSNRADADALAEEAVAARVQEFQKERGLPDSAAALADYYETQFPGTPVPATREEQIAGLRERVPAPAALLADLGRRRVEATRERLVTVEGIPEARLPVLAGPPVAASTDTPRVPSPEATGGRVEFALAAGE
jgi:hypothetical protein